MAIVITYHGSRPTDGPGANVDALGPQIGAAVTPSSGATLAAAGLYRVVATAAHTVKFGTDATDATNGEPWASGDKELRWLPTGCKVYFS